MIKKAIATTAAGVLLVGALAVNAGAADGDPGTAPGGESVAQGRHPVLRGAIRVAAAAAAETIGVEPSALREAVRGGQTVGEFAESQGVDPDEVEQAIADALTARIDQALAEGKISENRAAKARDRVATFADRIVNGHPRQAGVADAAPVG
jgi:hypothetical protein